ncbi:uncharacterized protein LOC125178064 [Hyalella azteca]|uniref:Uncharacterized protein LOC125178064 n=1 Tax=Hyalella azteca TaxID=294128 RepID=A0A979FL53_HYAAZ|nr:uncharacterized protein LOC125178064 [Hyalella azteca]
MPEWGFCYAFNLPLSEVPLQGWTGGRRCTLVNRDRSLTSAFKTGRLYLTRSFLCFERSRSIRAKNIKLALANIAEVLKAESCSWIPGGGMAIEVCMKPDENNTEDAGLSPQSSAGEEETVEKTGVLAPVAATPDNSIAAENKSFGSGDSTDKNIQGEEPQLPDAPACVPVDNMDVSSQAVQRRKFSKKKMKRKLQRRKNRTQPQSYFFGGIRSRDDAYDSIVMAVARAQTA